MELKDRPNIKKRNAKFGPVLDGNWLVRWLHLHTFVYMIKTIFKPIGNKDMNNTREELYPERTYSEYLKARLKNVVGMWVNSAYELRQVNIPAYHVLAAARRRWTGNGRSRHQLRRPTLHPKHNEIHRKPVSHSPRPNQRLP